MATAVHPRTRSVQVGARSFPVLLPSVRDARLHIAAVTITVHILGQTVLGFELSIAQILATLATCALLEFVITAARRQVLMWPASALLTGNGIALVLRVNGTVPGDRWSTNGLWFFVITAAGAVLSKHLLRVDGRPLFNPSNAALVVCFLVVGSDRVNPLDLWWGPFRPPVITATAVILVGGLLITRRLQLLQMSALFWLTYTAGVGVVAALGHTMRARWHVDPVGGWLYWRVLVTSPEILIFLFFMITDPKTIPERKDARLVHAALVGVLAAVMIAAQRTEFATKVSILGALVLACVLRPLLDRLLPATSPAPTTSPTRVAAWRARRAERQGPTSWGWAAPAAAGWVAALALVGVLLLVTERNGTVGRTVPVERVPRPIVTLDYTLPTVRIDRSVDALAEAPDRATAQRMARDLAENLIIEGQAVRSANIGLAASALTGERFADTRAIIDTQGAAAPAPPVYTFTAVTLVAHRTSEDPQVPPTLALRVEGLTRATTSGSRSTTFVRLFELREVDGHFLIAADTPLH